MRRLEEPREVHDGVGAAEPQDEVVVHDVRHLEARDGAAGADRRGSSGEAHDLVGDFGAFELVDEGSTGIPGRAHDHDAHDTTSTGIGARIMVSSPSAT